MGVACFVTSLRQEGVAGHVLQIRIIAPMITIYIITITLSCLKITNRVGIVLTLEGEHAQLLCILSANN